MTIHTNYNVAHIIASVVRPNGNIDTMQHDVVADNAFDKAMTVMVGYARRKAHLHEILYRVPLDIVVSSGKVLVQTRDKHPRIIARYVISSWTNK